MRVKLTNILQVPFTHQELSELQEETGEQGQPLYNRVYTEHQSGDIVELSPDACENLIITDQAVQLDSEDNEIRN